MKINNFLKCSVFIFALFVLLLVIMASKEISRELSEFEQLEIGMTRYEVFERFGNPDGMLSGLFGDTYHISDEERKMAIIYYEGDRDNGYFVTDIKITNRQI